MEGNGSSMESRAGGQSSASSLKGADGVVHLKVLVPSVAAGAIIGKGGETIADIQKQTGGKIKMSKSNDFYPGTSERVCLITGSLDSVSRILDFVMEKIREKPDPNAKTAMDFDNKVTAEREKQVKLLIPNSTAGMIIGKGGQFIKQLKDESGAFIQISQKSKDTALQERVVTVIGEPDSNRKAVQMILEKILEDPQSGSCLNISYSDVHGLVANFNPTGSPFAQPNGQSGNGSGNQSQESGNSGGANPANSSSPKSNSHHHHHTTSNGHHHSSSHHNNNNSSNSNSSSAVGQQGGQGGHGVVHTVPTAGATPSPFVLPLHGGGSLQLKFNLNPNRPPTDPSLMSQYLDHIKAALSSLGYGELAIDEIAQSISCLAHHGILVVNLLTQTAVQGSGQANKNGGQPSANGVSPAGGGGGGGGQSGQQQAVHFNAHPQPQLQPLQPGLGDFMKSNGGGNPSTGYPRPPPPPPPPSAAASNAAAAAVAAGQTASGADGTNHLSAGFGGYGSPQAAAAAGPHFRGYWGNGQAVAESSGLHMVQAVVDPNVAAPPPQLPEPFRGPATSPFSQPKYQGNKNSFGLATGPPLQPQQQQQPPTVSAAGATNGTDGGHGQAHSQGQAQVTTHQGPVTQDQLDQVELEVNESIIGAVIGPQGKCIVDIQQFSGARIQISKKGTYSPGTRNRLVNIQGSPKSISAAKYLIEKKIVEEEGKRERQAAAAAAAAQAAQSAQPTAIQPSQQSHAPPPPQQQQNGGPAPSTPVPVKVEGATVSNYWDCIIRNGSHYRSLKFNVGVLCHRFC